MNERKVKKIGAVMAYIVAILAAGPALLFMFFVNAITPEPRIPRNRS